MTQNNHQSVNVTVNVGMRRRWRFPLLGVIGFTIAFFWPMALWHGTFGTVMEFIWVAILALVWAVVLLARSMP